MLFCGLLGIYNLGGIVKGVSPYQSSQWSFNLASGGVTSFSLAQFGGPGGSPPVGASCVERFYVTYCLVWNLGSGSEPGSYF